MAGFSTTEAFAPRTPANQASLPIGDVALFYTYMNTRLLDTIGSSPCVASDVRRHFRAYGVVLGLLGTVGCAQIASGPAGTYLDAAGHPSQVAADAARLRASCGEAFHLSSRNFGALEFTFENPTENWQRVEKVQLDFGSEKINQAVSIPWGSQLESWAEATHQRNAIRETNERTALEVIGLSAALVSTVAAPRNPALRAAGGIVSLSSAVALMGADLQTRAEAAGQVPTFSGNHLLALPFEVPPGLFAKRWILVSTPSDPQLGCISVVTLTYELADKTSHKVALTFRQSASSEWQKAACLAKYPDANP